MPPGAARCGAAHDGQGHIGVTWDAWTAAALLSFSADCQRSQANRTAVEHSHAPRNRCHTALRSGTCLRVPQLQVCALANLSRQACHIAVARSVVQRERHGWLAGAETESCQRRRWRRRSAAANEWWGSLQASVRLSETVDGGLVAPASRAARCSEQPLSAWRRGHADGSYR